MAAEPGRASWFCQTLSCSTPKSTGSWARNDLLAFPIPRLPQEIVDAIIDEVLDSPTLWNCALVSRACWRRSQRRLFYQVQLGHEKWARPMAEEIVPRYGHLFREVFVQGSQLNCKNYFLSSAVLPNVDIANLYNGDFSDRALAELISARFKNIKRLQLMGCNFPCQGDLLRFLNSFPLLKDLSLHDQDWSAYPIHMETSNIPKEEKLQLPSLCMEYSFCEDNALDGFMPLFDVYSITTFSTMVRNDIDCSGLNAFCQQSGSRLRHLTVLQEPEELPALILKHNTGLKSLTLAEYYPEDGNRTRDAFVRTFLLVQPRNPRQ